MLGVLEYHVYGLVFENDLLQRDNVLMRDLFIELESRLAWISMQRKWKQHTAISRMALWLIPV